MMAAGRDELYCDLAETYGLFDMYALPLDRLAALAVHLPEGSRIRRKLAGLPVSPELLLQAMLVDRIGLLTWMQSKDGIKNRNRPKSLAEILLRGEREAEPEEKPRGFSTGADFMEARRKLLRRS